MIDDTKCRFGVKRGESNPIVLTPFGMCRHVLPVLYPLGSVTEFPSLSLKFCCAFLSNGIVKRILPSKLKMYVSDMVAKVHFSIARYK